MRRFEMPATPPNAERAVKDPKVAERSALERFQSPAGRFLAMAAIALSTEGCATFKKYVLKPVVSGITLESGPMTSVEISPVLTPAGGRIEVKTLLQQEGDRAWWLKPDGMYLPPGARKTWDAKMGGVTVKERCRGGTPVCEGS